MDILDIQYWIFLYIVLVTFSWSPVMAVMKNLVPHHDTRLRRGICHASQIRLAIWGEGREPVTRDAILLYFIAIKLTEV